MGRAGGEGAVAASCRLDLEHSIHDECIGGCNEEERHSDGQSGCHQNREFMDVTVGTKQAHQGWNIAEEVLDTSNLAKWQREDEDSQLKGQEQANSYRGHHQAYTEC